MVHFRATARVSISSLFSGVTCTAHVLAEANCDGTCACPRSGLAVWKSPSFGLPLIADSRARFSARCTGSVVHGAGGCDERSVPGRMPTRGVATSGGVTIDPADAAVKRPPLADLAGLSTYVAE